MANELWKERVRRAQEATAERKGIDISVMLPPRDPSEGGNAHSAETATAKAVAEAPVADVVAEAEAIVEAAPQVAVAEAAAAQAAGGDAAADRVAAAKARAAAKATNGAAGAAPAPKPTAPKPAPAKAPVAAAAPAEVGQAGMNRREFVTYAWAAALGLVSLEGGLATYLFMYPRFKAGQFGGKFDLGPATILPPTDAAPKADAKGKFWLVNTDAGPKAIYMVCTHLGCLYKWEPSNNRFECPCHGSKFSREGFYIEGPAPRSLDQFSVEAVDGNTTNLTTDSDQGAIPPAVPSPTAEIFVNTGKKINGRPSSESPANNSG